MQLENNALKKLITIGNLGSKNEVPESRLPFIENPNRFSNSKHDFFMKIGSSSGYARKHSKTTKSIKNIICIRGKTYTKADILAIKDYLDT